MTTDTASVIPESHPATVPHHIATRDEFGVCTICAELNRANRPDHTLAIAALETARANATSNAGLKRLAIKRFLTEIEVAVRTIRTMVDNDGPIDVERVTEEMAAILKNAPELRKPLSQVNEERRRANMLRGAIETLRRDEQP